MSIKFIEVFLKKKLNFIYIYEIFEFFFDFNFLYSSLKIMKYNLFIKACILIDIFVIDYPKRINRFDLVYNLLSLSYNTRILLKFLVYEFSLIPSICSLFLSANWLERETYDMFGLFFLNHPDLRRILTDYGFEGFPLKKEFPISGFLELFYDENQKKIIYEKISLSQEYRIFDFNSPWEN